LKLFKLLKKFIYKMGHNTGEEVRLQLVFLQKKHWKNKGAGAG
jgi:hypothetical protein